MIQQSRALAALPEDHNSQHPTWWLTTICSFSRGPNALFGLLQTLDSMQCIGTHTDKMPVHIEQERIRPNSAILIQLGRLGNPITKIAAACDWVLFL